MSQTDTFAEIRAAIAAGNEERARDLLRTEIRNNPSAEAYFLASTVAYNDLQRKMFLDHAIEIDPFHAQANAELSKMAPLQNEKPKRNESVATPSINGQSSTAAGAVKPLADPAARLVAFIIDLILTSLLGGVVGAIGGIFFGLTALEPTMENLQTFSLVLSLIVLTGYHVYFLTTQNGQTPGKRLVNIRIVKKDGSKLTAADAFLRNVVGYLISNLIFWLGFVWIMVDKDRQGWHDKMVNTIVVQGDRPSRDSIF
ncbi:MAG: RDD family protein [Chloroflexota bacterium]|nr:RDD family protein [Chloroflexota bacterium]